MGMGMDTLYCETFNAQQSKRFIHTFPYEPSSARAVLRDFAFLVAPSLRIRSAAFVNLSSIGSQKLCAGKWLQFSNILK